MMTEEQKQKHRERIALNRLLKIIDGEMEPNPPKRLITISKAIVCISDKNNKEYKAEMEEVYIDINVERSRIIIHGKQIDGEQFIHSEHLHECKFMGENNFPAKNLRIFSDKDNWLCVIQGKEDSTIELSQYFLDTRKIIKGAN